MKRLMWGFLALLIIACAGVYLSGGMECFAASSGTAGAAVPGDHTKAYITLGILAVAALAKEPVPAEVCSAYNVDKLEYGFDYIIPKPLDPRILTRITPADRKSVV